MPWKRAARLVLHHMDGLAVLRKRHRHEFGVLMFHTFREQDQDNVEALCTHLAEHFEPVSMTAVVDALDGRKTLPYNAATITVDDGYRNFLEYGHPIFRHHRIPVTLYAVAGFADGKLWLWTDQIDFGLRHTRRSSIRAAIAGCEPLELNLATPKERATATVQLTDVLKQVPNDRRTAFLAEFGTLCGVEIPLDPPKGREPMNWDELRGVAAEGVEIGCHTQTHPILSRLSSRELECETRGAKQYMEERLRLPVRHFCYPNGRPIDVGEAAMRSVKQAGFETAVNCTWGLNTVRAERFQLRRIPFRSDMELGYGKELLAGLHM